MYKGCAWENMKECPPWYDKFTRGCPHPDGVIIAGSSREGCGMKVAFMDMRHNKNFVMLPNLKYNLKHPGMNYDVDAKILTIAGGEKYDGGISSGVSSTSAVFQLHELTEKAVWTELKSLPYTVVSPMVVNDAKYLYVLGGFERVTCVRMCKEKKENWETLGELPQVAGHSKAVNYCGHLFGGALWFKNKVTVFTRTKYLTLDNIKKIWKPKKYGINPVYPCKSNIRHLTPILEEGGVVAGIRRKRVKSVDYNRLKLINVERFVINPDPIGSNYWASSDTAPDHSRLGAGRFLSVQFNKTTSD